MAYLFWFVASALLVVIELLTASLMFASFALGAVVAGIVGAMGFDLVGQGIAFALASMLAVFLFRPILSKRFVTRNSQHATNVLALIGAHGTVTQTVSPAGGQVKVRGEVWSAKSDSSQIQTNQDVTITDIDGVTLVVKPSTAN